MALKYPKTFYFGKLTKGCLECLEGKKLVLFISGVCKRKCFYCPLTETRMGIDAVWANEKKLSKPDAVSEAVEEARLCSARGAGITGGDPLLRLGRTIKYIKALKKAFGKKFHIHIYLPTENTTQKKLESLAKARVDEVRFHPLFLIKNTEKEIEKIMLAVSLKKKYKWKVGIEVPVIPKTEKALIRFIEKAKKLLDFVNLNELELSVLNAPVLMKRGMTWKKGSAAVKSSEQTAALVNHLKNLTCLII